MDCEPQPHPTNNIYYNAGNVGIGTNAPDQKLVVSRIQHPRFLHLTASFISWRKLGAALITIDGFAAAPVYLLRRANNTAASRRLSRLTISWVRLA